ncbi:MAG: LexA family protein [Clostridia bacterium]
MNRIKFLREEFNMTQQELADKLNGAKSTVAMYEKGDRKPSLEILVKLSEIFDCSIDYILCKTDVRNAVINLARIPILGTVKAGYDWLAEENVVDYITLKENIPNIKEYYALRITGDSMLPLLSEGDLVIVHDQDDVESGQTAVVLINGEEATVKKVVKTNEGIELHSMNPYYPVKKFTFEDMKKIPVKIIGRVKEAKIKGAFE